MKISTIVALIMFLDLLALFFLGLRESPNIEIIKILGDVAKVLSGGLAGLLAGEKNEK